MAKKTSRRAKSRREKKTSRRDTKRRGSWVRDVAERSDAMDLPRGIFKGTPVEIARGLRRSALRSTRTKGTKFQSAMSMPLRQPRGPLARRARPSATGAREDRAAPHLQTRRLGSRRAPAEPWRARLRLSFPVGRGGLAPARANGLELGGRQRARLDASRVLRPSLGLAGSRDRGVNTGNAQREAQRRRHRFVERSRQKGVIERPQPVPIRAVISAGRGP